jgi:hypothetical protein
MSRFHVPPAAGTHPIVRLFFPNTAEKTSLYCHEPFLHHFFHVFRDLQGVADTTCAPVYTASGSSKETSADDPLAIPLDEASCAAFQDALSFMYPEPPLPSITWDNVWGLLLLAHKYNSPYFMGEALRQEGKTKPIMPWPPQQKQPVMVG